MQIKSLFAATFTDSLAVVQPTANSSRVPYPSAGAAVTNEGHRHTAAKNRSKGKPMKSFILPVIGGALATAALGLAGAAAAAPSGGLDASRTIGQLQARGFDVVVNKLGTAPLDQCAVSAVRPGQT